MKKRPSKVDIFPVKANYLAQQIYSNIRMKTPFEGKLWTKATGEILDYDNLKITVYYDEEATSSLIVNISDNQSATVCIQEALHDYAVKLVNDDLEKEFQKKIKTKLRGLK